MKHFFKGWLALVLVLVICICCSNSSDIPDNLKYKPFWDYTAQEWYDHLMKHSVIKDSAGHTLILHEVATRGYREYTFSIEHSPECKKCLEIFD